ncbi:MAG: cytochrome d ubiquinol oxidase subunit II [Ktedonobacterales bacterium]
MPTLWFILVLFMITMYVLLDGFDLGAGILHLIVARTNAERQTVLRAIGPVWDGNEVWLIAAGGTLFFAFPPLYAASFSGFYLPLIIVLWLLMLRGVAVELRHHISNPVWASLWDGTFFLGSALLAIFYGAAAGNVVRGVPLDSRGLFFEPLWTDFNPLSRNTGILDWYTIVIGLLAFAALTTHGANYLAVKTTGMVYERARRLMRVAWVATVVLTVLSTIATFAVQPAMGAGFAARPWAFIFPLIALAGLGATLYFQVRRRDLEALFASGAYLAGMLASAAAGLYPMVLPAVNPANSLTIYNASASQYGQTVGLVWWSIGMVLAIIYFVVIYRLFWGKVHVAEGGEAGY